MPLLRSILALGAAYTLGALPLGYLVVRRIRGIDIRSVGSGHTGGTNVLRAAGWGPALLTVAGDMAKGFAAVALARLLLPEVALLQALAGVIAVVGHDRSVFLGFRGGVGTMTTLGAALALMPIPTAAALSAGIAVLVLWKQSSLASLTFAGLLTVGALVSAALGATPADNIVFAAGTTVAAVWELRPNIQRLRQGTERKLTQFIPAGRRDVVDEGRKPQ